MGANIVTTCSANHKTLYQQLGASEVVNYKKVNVLTNLQTWGVLFNLVINNMGSSPDSYNNRHKLLKAGGTFGQAGVRDVLRLKLMR